MLSIGSCITLFTLILDAPSLKPLTDLDVGARASTSPPFGGEGHATYSSGWRKAQSLYTLDLIQQAIFLNSTGSH